MQKPSYETNSQGHAKLSIWTETSHLVSKIITGRDLELLRIREEAEAALRLSRSRVKDLELTLSRTHRPEPGPAFNAEDSMDHAYSSFHRHEPSDALSSSELDSTFFVQTLDGTTGLYVPKTLEERVDPVAATIIPVNDRLSPLLKNVHDFGAVDAPIHDHATAFVPGKVDVSCDLMSKHRRMPSEDLTPVTPPAATATRMRSSLRSVGFQCSDTDCDGYGDNALDPLLAILQAQVQELHTNLEQVKGTHQYRIPSFWNTHLSAHGEHMLRLFALLAWRTHAATKLTRLVLQ